MSPRQLISRRLTVFAVSIVAASVGAVAAGQGGVAATPYTLEERATAIASPSMVYLERWVTGNLFRRSNSELVNPQPITLVYRCSGFVASAQGHVITSGHCIQPGKAIDTAGAGEIMISDLVRRGSIPGDQKQAYIDDVNATMEFGGEALGTPPHYKVYGQLFQGQGTLNTDPAMQAESLQIESPELGVAVVKFGTAGMPVAEISPTPLNVNAPIVPLGFAPDKFSDLYKATYTVRSAATKIIGRYGDTNPPAYQLEVDLGVHSRGGVVVDSGGRVVGLINSDPAAKDPSNRVITNIEHIKTALGTPSLNALTPVDQNYRAGLDAYFGSRYSEAIVNLDKVLEKSPKHPLAPTYRNLAAERKAVEGGGESGGNTMLPFILVLGALVLCVAAILALVIRNRRIRQQQQQQQFYYPPDYAPISGLPISGHPISSTPASGPGQPYGYVTYGSPMPAEPPPDTAQYPLVTGLNDAPGYHQWTQSPEDQTSNPWGPPPSKQ